MLVANVEIQGDVCMYICLECQAKLLQAYLVLRIENIQMNFIFSHQKSKGWSDNRDGL